MPYTINPSIAQGYLQTFEANFNMLAQQKNSKMLSTPAVEFAPVKGVSFFNRLGSVELTEVTGVRNPDKSIVSMSNDVRRYTSRRFTKTFIVDNYDAAVNLITDPTSDLFMTLEAAKNRTADRVLIEAAVGNVIVGAPDTAGTSKTAAEDGVLTIAGTSNFDYANVVTIAERNFINNQVEEGGYTFALSAKEEYLLKQDAKFISNDYTNARPVDGGGLSKVGDLNIVKFAGSVNGVVTINDPILPESGGVRKCVAFAKNSMKFGMDIGAFSIDKSATKVNSWEITIDVYFKALRKEGAGVQIITATV